MQVQLSNNNLSGNADVNDAHIKSVPRKSMIAESPLECCYSTVLQ